MADSESDRIAKMLHALSSGEHAEDESHRQEPHDDNIFGAPSPEPEAHAAPAPVAPKPVAAKPAAPKPPVPTGRPLVVPRTTVPAATTAPSVPKSVAQPPRPTPAAPKPVQPGSSVAPRPIAPVIPKSRPLASPQPGVAPSLPPQPVARPAPPPPPPVQAPATGEASEEPAEPQAAQMATEQQPAEQAEEPVVVADESTAEEQAYDADDQMEMPAVPTSILAQRPRKPIYKRKHLVQTIEFKQAMIPISFTLFIVCIAYVVIGFAADLNSPFAALRSPVIAGALGLVGLAMLATCVVTVGQVRHELATRQPAAAEPDQAA